MIDVGGYRLHLSQAGTTAPTVVFESGLGEDTSTWSKVQPEVAKFARTAMYDRAGIGKSDPLPGSQTRDMLTMARSLHTLLHSANIPGPYILVGHSLGGALIQIFAHMYPKEIAGLVLVDPEDGRLIESLHEHMSAADWDARSKAMEAAMPNMPAFAREELKATEKTAEYVPEMAPLPHVPVVLLSGTLKNPEFPGNPLEQDLKLELQNNLLATVPDSKHVLVPNSRHYIQDDAPELVVEAIRSVAAAQNSKEPSPSRVPSVPVGKNSVKRARP